ncbi:hypothetical protein HU200_045026 [Digitaria exilis]|uniref:Uncharacterized protein n=1 Tax=Digitaria exilis TaxID=1010633 RepID=A0A835B3I8_9POAL|nr:hypothetical protein HU200_045026 [Digitaria exilis]
MELMMEMMSTSGSPVAMDGKVGKGGNHNKERKKKRTKWQLSDRDAPLFFTDRYAADGVDDLPIYKEDLVHGDEEDGVVIKGRKPVWVDEEEERTEGKEYEARLRGQHAKLNPFTGWADMDRKTPLPGASDAMSDDEGGVDDILQNNDELVVKDSVKLLPGAAGVLKAC